MAAAKIPDSEDYLTCSVCFNEYDEKSHIPKFLICFHTLCVQCVKSMSKKVKSLLCPLCRKETPLTGTGDDLVNNIYILQMIVSKETAPTPSKMLKNIQWCLKCSKKATKYCLSLSDHPTFSMGSKSPQFCRELGALKDEVEERTATVINKRKEGKHYFEELYKSLRNVEDAVKKLDEENDLHLAEMVSLLEGSGTGIPEDESAASLSRKLKESSRLLKEELKSMQDLDDRFLTHLKNTTITAHLTHGEKGDFPDVVIPPNPTSQSFLLASHLLLSSLKLDQIIPPPSPSQSTAPEPAVVDDPLPPTADEPITDDTPPPELIDLNLDNIDIVIGRDNMQQFMSLFGNSQQEVRSVAVPPEYFNRTSAPHGGIEFLRSIFSLKFSQKGRTLGNILFRPNPHFYRDFAHTLGRYCQSSPKRFEVKFVKAFPASFAVMGFSNPDFEMVLPEPAGEFLDYYQQMARAGRVDVGAMDVGFFDYEFEGESLTSFQLAFLLREYDAHNLRSYPPPKFGTIVGGENVVENLSRMRRDQRNGFSVTIECYSGGCN